jgi:hypothetical protein
MKERRLSCYSRIPLGPSLAGDKTGWAIPDSETDPEVGPNSSPSWTILCIPFMMSQPCHCCRMTLISTALPPEALTKEWTKLGPDTSLTLSAPGKEPLQVIPNQDALLVQDFSLKSGVWHCAW